MTDINLNKYALHHMIRDTNHYEFANDIKKYDERIQDSIKNGTSMGEEDITQYKNLIKKAKISVLQNQEIILCTCHASGSKVIKEGCNIIQVFSIFLCLFVGNYT